ncbi:MAG: biliverdin-producing heme oxygenase [Bacteroidota bacterium]
MPLQKNQIHLEKLRNATKPLHDELEVLTASDSMLDKVSLPAYRRFLSIHYLHHLLIAKQIQEAKLQILDWPECIRIAALQKDLEMLNADVSFADEMISDMDLRHSSQEACVGLCYVSEGSSMGNRMMLKHFKQDKHFRSWNADNFLSSSDRNFKKRWQSLLTMIHEAGEKNYGNLEAGGLFGFQSFATLWKKVDAISN